MKKSEYIAPSVEQVVLFTSQLMKIDGGAGGSGNGTPLNPGTNQAPKKPVF